MKTLHAFLFFGFILWPTMSLGEEEPCTELKLIPPQSLAFKIAEMNLKLGRFLKENPYRSEVTIEGRTLSKPFVCFAAFWGLDNQWLRAEGYKFAIRKWMALYSLDYRLDWWPEGMDVRKRIYQLTHKRFKDKEELKHWWAENEDYLIATKDLGWLYVDKKAKAAGKKYKLEIKDFNAETYWLLIAWSRSGGTWEDEKYIYAQAWDGLGSHGPSNVFFRVLKSESYKQAHKKKGAWDALNGVAGAYYPDYDPDSVISNSPFRVIKRVTGKTFRSYEELKEWWKANRGNVELSEDGKHLVVK